MDTKTRTVIKCKCGKKLINATDIPDIFEKGQITGHIKHGVKQVVYNIVFKIHALKKGHGFAEKYETYGEVE